MTYPIVRFVDAPDVDAEVRFDFNTAGEWSDDETWPEHDGFSLGVPTLEGDPDAYGVQYGLRQLEFNVIISAAYTDASRLWSQLAKELVSRRSNWLMFQFSAFSQPVWFKTYRTAPEALDFEQVDDTDDAASNLWGLGVQLAAEPFAYGERVTLPTFTVNNDPAATTNPCAAILPEILGDAPAPARFDMVADSLHSIPSPMFSVTPVPDDFTGPTVVQFGIGDAVTAGTDMKAAVSHASYSGVSYRPIDFATNTGMAKRATLTVPALRPGRYALMLRVGRPSTFGSFALKARIANLTEGKVVSMDRTTSPGAYIQWLDLGTFTLPNGAQDLDAASGTATTSVSIWAQQFPGGGELRFDALVVMPVEMFEGEPGMRLTTLPDFLNTSPWLARWDGDGEYFQLSSNGNTSGRNPAVLAGQFPVLSPGRRNALHLFRQTSSAAREGGLAGDVRPTTGNSDDVTMSTAVTVSYHPRWLWLAGS